MRSLALVIVLAGTAAAVSLFGPKVADPSLTVRTAPAVDVVTSSGKSKRFKRESLRKFVVFGYTRCSDECPILLGTLASQLRVSGRPRVLFVTTDPAHDTAPVLASYVAPWGRLIEGIAGKPDSIARIYEALTGAPSLPPAPSDHIAKIYYVNREAEVVPLPDVDSLRFRDAVRTAAAE